MGKKAKLIKRMEKVIEAQAKEIEWLTWEFQFNDFGGCTNCLYSPQGDGCCSPGPCYTGHRKYYTTPNNDE